MASSVLITGGGGFLAQHLIGALGAEARIFVHRRREPEVHAETSSNVALLSGSLNNPSLIDKLTGKTETVFHLAGAFKANSTMELINANVVSTANVIELMGRARIPHLVFLSSAAVWSGNTSRRIDEGVPPSPNTPYGFAKLAAEAIVNEAVVQGKIVSATILRCNNTYGPGSQQGVVSNFYRQIRTNQEVLIDGDGMQLREPLFVTDLMQLLLKVGGKSRGVRVYGVSGPDAMTVMEIAQTVAEAIGKELKISWGDARSDRSRHLMISTKKIETELNWQAKTCLLDGLRTMLAKGC